MVYIPITQLSDIGFHIEFVRGLHQRWCGKYPSGFSYTDLKRPDSGILILLSGNAVYSFGERFLKISPDDVISLPEGCNYRADFHTADDHCETFLVNFRLVSDSGETIAFEKQPNILTNDKSGMFRNLFEKTVANSFGRNTFGRIEAFCKLMDTIIRRVASESCSNNTVAEITDYIETHISEGLNVSELSERFKISEATLRRIFASNIGIPPNSYIIRQKIERAKEMLLTTECTNETICEELNFYDVSHFFKCFKKLVGTTPGEFVKQSINSVGKKL